MLKLNHKNLDVWQIAMKFVSRIYKTTKVFPKEELFGLTNQIRRAAVSIVSNITKGSARSSAADRKKFYEISRPSLVEIDTQLENSQNLGYINEKNIQELGLYLEEIFAKISNLIKK
ncbi:MAG: four helix bundle protein [Ignavibacteria bacterium]|nr:four helix bundle protein [Ignavibacteria bacterium]